MLPQGRSPRRRSPERHPRRRSRTILLRWNRSRNWPQPLPLPLLLNSTRRCRRVDLAASSAWSRAAGGSTCDAARSAGTSGAATPRPHNTPPVTRRPADTRSSAASSRVRTGSTAMAPRNSGLVLNSRHLCTTHSTSPSPARRAEFLRTGRLTCTTEARRPPWRGSRDQLAQVIRARRRRWCSAAKVVGASGAAVQL